MRHGETAWNAENRILGSTDMPLNEKGRAQAADAAEKMKDIRFDVIYTSCLSRSMETGLAVGALQDCPVIHEACLNEHDFGDFEGKDRCSEHYQNEKRKCLPFFLRRVFALTIEITPSNSYSAFVTKPIVLRSLILEVCIQNAIWNLF